MARAPGPAPGRRPSMASKMIPSAEWQRIKEDYRFYRNDAVFLGVQPAQADSFAPLTPAVLH